MMLDDNAQAIFLLTYIIAGRNVTPLNAQEYSFLAKVIRNANLEGPGSLLSMSETEISDVLSIQSDFSSRLKELLSHAGTATLYLDRFFNQGFGLITRTDNQYPASLKKNMHQNCPSYLTYVGDGNVLNSLVSPLIVPLKKVSSFKKLHSPDKRQDIIVVLETARVLKQLKCLDDFDGKILLLCSIGLSHVVRLPVVRQLLNRGLVQIVSTTNIEAKESVSLYSHLLSIASALSGTNANQRVNDIKGSDAEQVINYDCVEKTEDEKVKEFNNKYHTTGLPVNNDRDSTAPEQTEVTQRVTKQPDYRVVYTIGHSNHDIEKFLGLLKTFCIEILVDLRSLPNSNYVPQFNQGNLKEELSTVGVQYMFLGNSLGGRPEDKTVLNSQGQIVREFIEGRDWYRDSIKNLKNLIRSGKKIALMCAEEDPTNCHRGYIVGNTLLDGKFIVKHIRQDGKSQIRGSITAPSDQMELEFE